LFFDDPLAHGPTAQGNQPAAIRVAIVDDHLGVAQTLEFALQQTEDIEVVGVAQDGPTGLALVERARPDVLVPT
jgi:DNA-binding NarL/FixJ family response regulator